MTRRSVSIGELRVDDTVETGDDIRRGGFVFFERIAPGRVIQRVVPGGAILLALRRDDSVVAVLSDESAETLVPDGPLYFVDLEDVEPDGDGGATMQITHLPVHLSDDPALSPLAHFRSALPKIPISRHNPFPCPMDHWLSEYALFYRDTSSLGDLMNLYEPGRILRERGFTDASALRGRLMERTRFLIISREGHDMEQIPPSSGSGLATLMADATFLLADRFSRADGRTQVALLHVPSKAIPARFLGNVTVETMALITRVAREDLTATSAMEPVSALTRPQWLDRVADPVGMDADGGLYLDAWHTAGP